MICPLCAARPLVPESEAHYKALLDDSDALESTKPTEGGDAV